MGKRARVAVGGLLGLTMLLGLTACGSDNDNDTKVLGRNNLAAADIVVDKVDSLHTYDPKSLTIELNTATSFTVANRDSIVHNVTIPAFVIDMDVQPGQRIEVKLPAVAAAPRDGFFLFYCKYHQAEGEAGRINIAK